MYCSGNELTELNLSKNTALELLYCSYNSLLSLNLLNNEALTSLDCGNNDLVSLDLSMNKVFTYLDCGSNALTSLNLKNGNNTNMEGYYGVYLFDNPDLICVQVDNEDYSTRLWGNAESTTGYSENCNYTFHLFTEALNGFIVVDLGAVNGIYSYGTVVELTANPPEGYGFSHWSGSLESIENPLNITVN